MRSWIKRRRREGQSPDPYDGPVLELLALEGDDAGQRFTIDGPETLVGHGKPRDARTGAILLHDRTVSSRQAVIRSQGSEVRIEHREGATNPTLVNGAPIGERPLRPGDRIQVGRVVLEVRDSQGTSLARFSRGRAGGGDATEVWGASQTTEVRRLDAPRRSLCVVGEPGARFELCPGENRIGRAGDCQVVIDWDHGVSRRHADVVWEGEELILVHRSGTNPTLVNGTRVEDRVPLSDGDEIQLADRVLLRLERDVPAGAPRPGPRAASPAPAAGDLLARMEEKLQRDEAIEQDFRVFGSFLDVDVVGSYNMKQDAAADRIIVSFERWRFWVRQIIEEFAGQVLNSNGDELMCFFESPHQAVRSGSAVLARLPVFNADQNLLPSDFHLRIGIHTGDSLVDRSRGVAFSSVLDVAGHLQKEAEVDGLLISESTRNELPDGLPFEEAGKLAREGIRSYRLTAPLE